MSYHNSCGAAFRPLCRCVITCIGFQVLAHLETAAFLFFMSMISRLGFACKSFPNLPGGAAGLSRLPLDKIRQTGYYRTAIAQYTGHFAGRGRGYHGADPGGGGESQAHPQEQEAQYGAAGGGGRRVPLHAGADRAGGGQPLCGAAGQAGRGIKGPGGGAAGERRLRAAAASAGAGQQGRPAGWGQGAVAALAAL